MRWSRFLGILPSILVFALSAAAQEAPQYIRVGAVRLKSGGQYNYQELAKMVNKALGDAGAPWRQVFAPAIAGEMGLYYTVAPVKNFAQFDSPSAIQKMSAEDRARYTTLVANSVENVRYTIEEMRTGISLESNRTTDAKFMRIMSVRVKPGRNLEFEELIKSILPLYQKAGVKDFWVSRTILGGAVGEYGLLMPFDTWAELDALPAGEKLWGSAAAYKQYLAKVAETVDSAETMVVRSVPELSYRKTQ